MNITEIKRNNSKFECCTVTTTGECRLKLTPDGVESEVIDIFTKLLNVLKPYTFEYTIRLKYFGVDDYTDDHKFAIRIGKMKKIITLDSTMENITNPCTFLIKSEVKNGIL